LRAEYDDFADVYEHSIEDSPIAAQSLPFYTRLYVSCPGDVAELGVGTGRIAIEAARAGKRVIGVDNSPRMLGECRRRAKEAGVADRLTLVQGDFRDFALPAPVALIAMPFHTICDIADAGDRCRVLERVAASLLPGGRFVFDHFVFDAELAARFNNVPHLEAEYTDPATGNDVLFWTCGIYNFEERTIRVIAWSDEVDGAGLVIRRRYRRYTSCWIEQAEMRSELEAAGFDIEALYGDFDGGQADDGATLNLWIALRRGRSGHAWPSGSVK